MNSPAAAFEPCLYRALANTARLREMFCNLFCNLSAGQLVDPRNQEGLKLWVNELSDIARKDATRHARVGITCTFNDLRETRQAITLFRLEHQIIDPSANIQGQMGLLNTLSEQLASAIIELHLLMDGTERSADL